MPNGTPKKIQVSKDKTTIFVVVSISAVVSVAALVIGKGLWSQASYLGKVADKKEAAVRQLKENKEAVFELNQAFKEFDEKNPNLLGGSTSGDTDRDGTNGTLVLDALPSKYDFPAVASSLEKLLEGNTINSITGQDDSVVQYSAVQEAPVPIPFTASVVTSYDSFRQLLSTLNKSIRPIQVTRLKVSGTNGSLETSIEAKTFYQAERGLQIKKEVVQ